MNTSEAIRFTKEKCVYYNRTTNMRIITNIYEGIPENLVLNIIGWLIIMLSFAIMRKRAWDYGRLALVHKDNDRWTRIFYGTVEEVTSHNNEEGTHHSSGESFKSLDTGFFSWILFTIKISDERILAKCGHDAVQYLSFQRNVILLGGIVMLISLGIVLPINYGGTLEVGQYSFGHTTVSNLIPKSPWLWVHVTLAIFYLPLSIVIMRRFSVKLRFEVIDSVCRTLMITDIPRNHCDVNNLQLHFSEAYPEYEVQSIRLAYDVNKVNILDEERQTAIQARIYCEEYLKETGQRLEVYPYVCGYVFSWIRFLPSYSVDAIDYYTVEENRLRVRLAEEKSSSMNRPLGIAFVTMVSIEAAKRVYADHKLNWKKFSCSPPTSNVSHLLQPKRWSVRFAPPPTDIFWENLSESSTNRAWKTTMINTFLCLVLFFLTTPAILLNAMDTLKLREIEKVNPILSEFMPTLFLWTFSALLPVIVIKSDQWLSHWTRSERNHAIMRKTFIFLLFMVLILPSFGLASVQAFVEFAFLESNDSYRWECLFLPDKGAFFVNYVITSAFIGTGLELIRFPELILYSGRLALSRSRAESASAKKFVLWEFPFGVHYAWMLLIFAMTMVYSLSCPLITFFGLIYMLLKHFVDRYNIYFAYGPSKISQQIHATAINCVIGSVVLLQFSFMLLSILRRGLHDITIFALVGFIITIIFAFAQCFLQWCKSWSPIYYQSARSRAAQSPRKRDAFSQYEYVPDVLRRGSPQQQRNQFRASSSEDHTASPESVDAQIETEVRTPTNRLRHNHTLYQNYNGSGVQI